MSAAKRNPPFRAEHVGSLLRPDNLVKKRYEIAQGKAQESELAPIEEKAIADIVKFQQECGIHPISTGEYIRYVHSGIRLGLLSHAI